MSRPRTKLRTFGLTCQISINWVQFVHLYYKYKYQQNCKGTEQLMILLKQGSIPWNSTTVKQIRISWNGLKKNYLPKNNFINQLNSYWCFNIHIWAFHTFNFFTFDVLPATRSRPYIITTKYSWIKHQILWKVSKCKCHNWLAYFFYDTILQKKRYAQFNNESYFSVGDS